MTQSDPPPGDPSGNAAVSGALTPEVLDERDDQEGGEQVARPTKLIRIASMVRSLRYTPWWVSSRMIIGDAPPSGRQPH